MDNFAPQPLPPFPPRHKVKSQPNLSKNDPSEEEVTKLDPEAQLQKMLDEEYPPIANRAPQCDWHLGTMMSAEYPDPFTLPGLETVKQSLMHDIAAAAEVIVTAGQEPTEKETNTKEPKPLF